MANELTSADHIKGPFLNEARKGAYDAGKIPVLGDKGVDMILQVRTVATAMVIAVSIFWSPASGAQTIIGIVDDGPQFRALIPVQTLETEIQGLVDGEFDVRLPKDKRVQGGSSRESIKNALHELLNDPEVDIIVTTGIVGSAEAVKIDQLSKPVLASVVADANLQDVPLLLRSGRAISGKPNFNYLARVRLSENGSATIEQTAIDEAINVFHSVIGFDHLAVIIDPLTLASITDLIERKVPDIEARLGVKTTILPLDADHNETLRRLPHSVDAVMISPLFSLDERSAQQLAQRLIDKRLPSFSLLGRMDVEAGFLTGFGHAGDEIRYARRIALNVQRILLGENAGEIDVLIEAPQRLTINMRTAEAIGFYPRTAVLLDAERLFANDSASAATLRLRDAMAQALESNLPLRASGMSPLVSQESTKLARSQLLPQLGIDIGAARIDSDRAQIGLQPERSVDAQLNASLLVYSDDLHASAIIAAYSESASRYGYHTDVLDTLQAAASAYFMVLRARALESIQRSNLEVTHSNLELARLRQSIGASGRADVLRWESQLATDRENVLAAQTDTGESLVSFNQILNRAPKTNFRATKAELRHVTDLFEGERFAALIDNQANWRRFEEYALTITTERSPELLEADAILSAQERQALASKRKFYLPEVFLDGTWGNNISRGGARNNLSRSAPIDDTWAVTLSATWPLYTSGALRSRLNRDRLALKQTERERAALIQNLENRTRVALLRAGGSYPTLELSRDAAGAAKENFELVARAYRRGAVSVTALIDAQNAAVAASLRAADAQYAYLIHVVNLLRTISDFSLLVDTGSKEQWFQDVEHYIRGRTSNARR